VKPRPAYLLMLALDFAEALICLGDMVRSKAKPSTRLAR
jgi:hypothetical protein